MREQRVILEDGVHIAPIGRQAFGGNAEDFDMAARRLLEAGDEAQACRLARSRRSEHGKKFARLRYRA